jgi:hypothetical protein
VGGRGLPMGGCPLWQCPECCAAPPCGLQPRGGDAAGEGEGGGADPLSAGTRPGSKCRFEWHHCEVDCSAMCGPDHSVVHQGMYVAFNTYSHLAATCCHLCSSQSCPDLLCMQFSSAFDPEGLLSSRDGQPYADAAGLKASTVPVFMITGDRDKMCPPQVSIVCW